MRLGFYRATLAVFTLWMFFCSGDLLFAAAVLHQSFWQTCLRQPAIIAFLIMPLVAVGLWNLRPWSILLLVLATVLAGVTALDAAIVHLLLLVVTIITFLTGFSRAPAGQNEIGEKS